MAFFGGEVSVVGDPVSSDPCGDDSAWDDAVGSVVDSGVLPLAHAVLQSVFVIEAVPSGRQSAHEVRSNILAWSNHIQRQKQRQRETPPNHPGTLACAERIWQAVGMEIDPNGPRPAQRRRRLAWLRARAEMLKQEAMTAKVQAEALEQQAERIEAQVAEEEATPRDMRLEEEAPEGTLFEAPWPEE